MVIDKGTRIVVKNDCTVLRVDRVVVELMSPGYQTIVYFSDDTFISIEDLYQNVFKSEIWTILDKWNETPQQGD
jgi:hypothetical protein